MDDHPAEEPLDVEAARQADVPAEPRPDGDAAEDGDRGGHQDLLPQLTAILTARWRDETGRLAIGAPRRRLLEALRIDTDQLDAILQELADRAILLGLELRDYRRAGDAWCCLTAVHGGPIELEETDQGVLGLLIHLIRKSGRRKLATTAEIREILVGREYLTEHQLLAILRRLEYLGYIRRRRGAVVLDSRTTLELDDAAQAEIAEQAKVLIV